MFHLLRLGGRAAQTEQAAHSALPARKPWMPPLGIEAPRSGSGSVPRKSCQCSVISATRLSSIRNQRHRAPRIGPVRLPRPPRITMIDQSRPSATRCIQAGADKGRNALAISTHRPGRRWPPTSAEGRQLVAIMSGDTPKPSYAVHSACTPRITMPEAGFPPPGCRNSRGPGQQYRQKQR